jgi:hypothetical protein
MSDFKLKAHWPGATQSGKMKTLSASPTARMTLGFVVVLVFILLELHCRFLWAANAAAAQATALPGVYVATGGRPRVFLPPEDLKSIVRRIATAGAFSKAMFGRLTAQVESDARSDTDWSATYSGCDLDTYLRMYSIEATGGYASELRSDDELRQAGAVTARSAPPHGAAMVAARLALYAALIRVGAPAPTGALTAETAAKLSRQILLAWSAHGFRESVGGHWLRRATQFCQKGKPDIATQTNVGLQVARGVIYSVFAQDLLESFGGLDTNDAYALDMFHKAMFDLIVNAHNFDFSANSAWQADCERYSNHIAMQLAALLAIARSLNDEDRFNAVLEGSGEHYRLATPWLTLFNRIIYGENDVANACYPNVSGDGRANPNSFNTPEVFLGEIADRYRNANPLQGLGYAFGALRDLYAAAEILRGAGYDAYGYRGPKGQSIEAAAEFYACYVKSAGFGNQVTRQNSASCQNLAQYEGKIVIGAATPVVVGAFRFPGNAKLTESAPAAKTTGRAELLDPLFFGLWPD